MAIVRTVSGDIDPGDLGITLCHEHLHIELKKIFAEPEDAKGKEMAHKPVEIQNLGWIHSHYINNLDNLGLYDEETTIKEIRRFREAGGSTLVEVTPVDIGRDPEGLVRIAKAADLNIVMGSGYYVFGTHPEGMAERPEDDITEEIVRDVTHGVGNTGIKSGIIGEIGCTWPLHDNERKVLRAAARAQKETGAILTIHPGRDPAAPHEILDVIEGAGGEAARTIMGHLDRTLHKFADFKTFAERGCFLELDLFGLESAYYPFGKMDMPNDGRRIDLIIRLIEAGHLDQMLISHDIAFKHLLVTYGGRGYGHILQNAVPKMRDKGMSEAHITTLLEVNPRRALSIAKA